MKRQNTSKKSKRLKQYNFIAKILVLIVIIMVSVGILYKSKDTIQKKIVSYRVSHYVLPTLTPSPTPRPVGFVNNDPQETFQTFFHTDLNSLIPGKRTQMDCLEDPSGAALTREKIPKDEKIISILKILDEYKFSDEQKVMNEKTKVITIEHKGESSLRNVQITTICKIADTFYVFLDAYPNRYSGLLPKVYAGGGGPIPTFLGIFTDTKQTILSLDQLTDKPVVIQKKTGERSVFTMSAYFNCSRIFGLSGSNLYYSCGGGDGCCGSVGLFKLNLLTLKSENIVFCGNAMNGSDYSTTECYNRSKVKYFTHTDS